MDLDFLEIGTSNFRTIIQKSNKNTVGISVEPLSYYLKQLPNFPNVIKENVAIAFDNKEKEVEIYYVPEHIIISKNLPDWLRGCNSLSTYHPKHIELNVIDYVSIEKVKQIPIAKLLKRHNVRSINLLKIDTEGGDCDILQHFKKVLIENTDKTIYPKIIMFEANFLTPKEKVIKTINDYISLGYMRTKNKGSDEILVFRRGE